MAFLWEMLIGFVWLSAWSKTLSVVLEVFHRWKMASDSMMCCTSHSQELYLFIGHAHVLQEASKVEFLDWKFPKTNHFLIYNPALQKLDILRVRQNGRRITLLRLQWGVWAGHLSQRSARPYPLWLWRKPFLPSPEQHSWPPPHMEPETQLTELFSCTHPSGAASLPLCSNFTHWEWWHSCSVAKATNKAYFLWL